MPGDLKAAGFRTLVDLLWQDAEGAMVLVGPDHRLLRANPAAGVALARLGLGLGDVLQNAAEEIRRPDGTSVGQDDLPIERALAGETVLRDQFQIRYKGS